MRISIGQPYCPGSADGSSTRKSPRRSRLMCRHLPTVFAARASCAPTGVGDELSPAPVVGDIIHASLSSRFAYLMSCNRAMGIPVKDVLTDLSIHPAFASTGKRQGSHGDVAGHHAMKPPSGVQRDRFRKRSLTIV